MEFLPPVEMLGAMPSTILALVLFGTGVMLLLLGWDIYRVALVVLGVLIGAAMGAGLAFLVDIPMLILAIPLGLLVGVLSVGLEKVGAFVVGGMCGAVPLLAGQDMFGPGYGIYIAAGLAFIIAGVLAVMLWRPMIIVSFSVLGGWLMAQGVLIATDRMQPNPLRSLAAAHPYWTAGVMALITLIGVFFQASGREEEIPSGKKGKKK